VATSLEGGARPVILVVDDEAANRALVHAYLTPACEVHEAVDGVRALEVLERRSVDLVLLDVMMPRMNGFDVCRRIKEQSRGSYLPVILLTALGQQDDRNLGLQADADDFLTKPVDRQELLLRVRLFVRLRQQDARIHRQVAALEQRDRMITAQLAELRSLDSLKDELVSLMVHDLRNPLGGIMGVLESLEGSVEDPELRRDTHMALEASDRLRETLEDILQVRMLESGNIRLHREVIEAETLVGDAIASVWGAARARGVEISRVVDTPHPQIAGDRKLVRRAIENLLTNALKYSPAGGVVLAAIHSGNGDIEFEVADRGVGIPDSVKNELFQKFGSVEIARGEGRRGIGLGLYLVKLVAAAHGGRAVVRDREGGGTTFGIFLPNQAPSPAS
jgi:two-component system sensor histidine kinase/response regulator